MQGFKVSPAGRVILETNADESLPCQFIRIINPRRIERIEIGKHLWMIGTIKHHWSGDLKTGHHNGQRRVETGMPKFGNFSGGFNEWPVCAGISFFCEALPRVDRGSQKQSYCKNSGNPD